MKSYLILRILSMLPRVNRMTQHPQSYTSEVLPTVEATIHVCYSSTCMEGSHSGLVRAPAKRLLREIGVAGSNPAPSAILFPGR